MKSQERYASYTKHQVEKLHEFLEIHRIYPRKMVVLAVKFKYKRWAFAVAEEPGNYSIKLVRDSNSETWLRSLNPNQI